MLMDRSSCSVYVGAENGLFKGIDTSKNIFFNFNWNDLNRENEIVSLCWADNAESKVYVGQKNGIVKLFDCSSKAFVKQLELDVGESSMKSIVQYDNKIVTAAESGVVKVWSEDGKSDEVEINAGQNLCKMRQNPSKPYHIATGGEENDLKVWDLQQPSVPVFRAKNVRNDFLDLRVPVWVTDMQFIPDSNRIITCTRHHQIRLYDPSSHQRRPVISMDFESHPLVSLSLGHREHEVIVGSSRGRMSLIDLRKKALVCVYKGFAGSISCIQCHPSLPVVASCGLDRFLRIHDLNTRQLLKKVYLKSKLNCLLMHSNAQITSLLERGKEVAKQVEEPKPQNGNSDDELWDSMKIIKEKLKSKKRLSDITASLTGSQRKKKKVK